MITVRQATDADADAIVRLALRLRDASPLSAWDRARADFVADTLLPEVLDRGAVFLAETDDGTAVGLVALMTFPSILSGVQLADEVAWWVDPAHRASRAGDLLRQAAEAWAIHSKIPVLKFGAAYGSRLGTYLARHGYTPVDVVYLKRLGCSE